MRSYLGSRWRSRDLYLSSPLSNARIDWSLSEIASYISFLSEKCNIVWGSETLLWREGNYGRVT